MKSLFFLLLIVPSLCSSQLIRYREYKKGSKFRYQLTTETFTNGKYDNTDITVSQHSVIPDSGRLCEEVKFVSKKVFNSIKETILDSIAQKVPAFKLSLSRGQEIKMPPLTISEMTGAITDLVTFYVAVSPALHMHQLSQNRLSFQDSVLKGNFADGREILKGEDCIQVKQKLLTHDKEITIIQTLFLPPYYTGITPFIDTIGKETFEMPNNFQMVRKGTGDKVNLLWGVETFAITSQINNKTGQLTYADMTNELTLRMRYNCSADLKTYEAEFPLTIRRVLKLQLLK